MDRFEINKEVVCVKSHSLGLVKQGEIHRVYDLQLVYCKCSDTPTLTIDIGIPTPNGNGLWCGKCGTQISTAKNILFHHSLFAPIPEIESIIEELKTAEQPSHA